MGCTNDEIRAAMPSLTDDEIAVLKEYVTEHYDQVMEQDRRIRQRASERKAALGADEAEGRSRTGRMYLP